ncbi:hypothetical protein [Sphingomonas echinoides]|jgi:hypothetical protein|uniref:Secreted protein n=1 Tax=Sphingomonas echinoides TaxID=59803 RepID=A0ABU4PMS9_9SPHN|nr:hypothetical protein [Sphingomonas echinoides]MDX5985431.1 hypothetical protein [Sphingomonas echinoides]
MLRPFAVALLLATVPTATVAQSAPQASTTEAKQAESGKPPLRIRSVTLTGNETCPQASNPDQEIVVCARVGEPYRIPKALRDQKPIPAQNQSWVNRTAVMDEVGRRAGGLPDTCSPTGSGGQTGCAQMRAQQYAAEKAEAKRQASQVP